MNTIRVLLVEEVRLVRELLKSLINDQPDMHVSARLHEAQAALVRARELHPHVALIGGLQPEETRLQLVRSLRTALPDLKIVVMDFGGSDERVAEFVQAGAHAFILKDTAAASLLHAIRVAAAGGPVPVIRSAVPALAVGDGFNGAADHGSNGDGESVLTQREQEISVMISQGRSNKEIARDLQISLHTVKAHVRGIMGKLALRSRVEIAAYAFQKRSPLMAVGLAVTGGLAFGTEVLTDVMVAIHSLVGWVPGPFFA